MRRASFAKEPVEAKKNWNRDLEAKFPNLDRQTARKWRYFLINSMIFWLPPGLSSGWQAELNVGKHALMYLEMLS